MRVCLLLFVGFVLSVSSAATAHAQSTRRPDLNLFGRGLRDPQQSLGVRGSLGATWFDRLIRDDAFGADPTIPDSGWGSFATAALVYNLRLGRVTFDGTLGSSATYYPALAKPLRVKAFPGAGARTGWSWNVTERSQLMFSSSLSYRPLHSETILPGGGLGGGFGPGSDPNVAFLPQESAFVEGSYLSFSSSVGYRQELSRRWSLSGLYEYQRDVAFGIDPTVQIGSQWRQTAGTALHFAVTRNLSVRGGYRYSEGHFDDVDEPYRSHSADIGVDYGRGLVIPLGRSTTLALNGGAGAFTDHTGNQRYRLIGSAVLNHDIGRTWTSSAQYSRGIDSGQLLFREPMLTDTFAAYLHGLISRRVGFHSSASVQGGAFAFGSSGRNVLRGAANAGLQTALGRHLAVGLDYTYYYYRFDGAVTRPSGVASRGASQGVQVYLTAWAPIFQRGGRSNASR